MHEEYWAIEAANEETWWKLHFIISESQTTVSTLNKGWNLKIKFPLDK